MIKPFSYGTPTQTRYLISPENKDGLFELYSEVTRPDAHGGMKVFRNSCGLFASKSAAEVARQKLLTCSMM